MRDSGALSRRSGGGSTNRNGPRGHEHVVEALPRDRFESAIDEPAAGDEFSFWAESHAYDPNRR